MNESIMNCYFDCCAFINIVFGGLFVGIIASFLFVLLTKRFSRYKFLNSYRYLESKPEDDFDWAAYTMQKNNWRKREDRPNGSRVNIQLKKDTLILKLRQKDGRIWIGELNFQSPNYGVLFFKYVSEHEYGQKQFYIGNYTEGEVRYDYIFISPLNDRIFKIMKINDVCSKAEYHYGSELFLRKSSGT
jgi:hypothetical protein